ncbi:hypothetical protein CDD82_7586 [Ophiocordyceps australis]|uniref:Cytidyltransferase-like domain-containing protein n=1 Tax=Ophiocordyceps australis TaxID=1399860 RepID=A0A2C5ZND5_9HYPO|nr:hypothetical protein CDD82_7586 [Ophiocordyceps australis]
MINSAASLKHDSRASLLLLPVPHFTAQYRTPLAAALLRLSHEHTVLAPAPPPTLVIAVQAPGSFTHWKSIQALIAEFYALVASICSRHNIYCDSVGDELGTVDARLILVQPASTSPIGNFLSLADVASRHWKNVFYPSCGSGRALQQVFASCAEEKNVKLLPAQVIAVDSGNDSGQHNKANDMVREPQLAALERYNTVCLGGTFDHLHPGHKLLLHAAVMLLRLPLLQDAQQTTCCTLIIGISGDELLVKKQFADELQSWDLRARCVIDFLATVLDANAGMTPIKMTASPIETSIYGQPSIDLNSKQPNGSSPPELRALFRNDTVLVRCVNIQDAYGPTVVEEHIDAIVVSAETRAGALAINDRRNHRGWHELDVFEIDVLDIVSDQGDDGYDQDVKSTAEHDRHDTTNHFASKISSTEIRRRKAEARRQKSGP